jgi:thiamine biosynthesis lipoprotein
MGSVLSLWHEAREMGADEPESAAIPSKDALYEAALHTDVNSIVIDEESSTVYISDPKARIDVGAVAKGYATERAAELLILRGVRSYVLNVGGNIRTIGEKSKGKGWITGITNPDKSSKDSFSCKVSLSDTSLVTSGDYERFFIYGGEKYHHIIDPETNMPARYFSSVSIITKDSALADALSTALFCMSYEDGKRLAESIGDVGVIWIYSDGSLKKSDNVELVS